MISVQEMTIRELFAGLAMVGLLAAETESWNYEPTQMLEVAKEAVKRADDLIFVLSTTPVGRSNVPQRQQ